MPRLVGGVPAQCKRNQIKGGDSLRHSDGAVEM